MYRWTVPAALAGTVYFAGREPLAGTELWRSDGSAAGTTQVADLAPGMSGSYPGRFTAAGPNLFFAADDGTHGEELWVLEAPGPMLLRAVPPARPGRRPPLVEVLPLVRARDLYLAPFTPGSVDPDATLLGDLERPLAFYALDGPLTMQLGKAAAGGIRISF